MPTRTRAAIAVLLAVSGACTAEPSGPDAAQISSKSGTLSVVQVERWGADSAAPRVLAGAKVARYAHVDGETVLDLLGAASPELESCRVAGTLALGALEFGSSVELLDVGALTVRLGERSARIEPRVFPALSTVAAGVFYAGHADLGAPRAEQDELAVGAPGYAGIGAFEVVVPVPAEPAEVSLDGQDDEASWVIARSRALELSWAAEDPRDLLELELVTGGQVLQCSFRDDGFAKLTTADLAMLEADEGAALTVRRVRLAPFDMQGVEVAFARIASVRTFELPVH